MNFRLRALALHSFALPAFFAGFLLAAVPAHAQTAQQADFIVAVVNSEPITNSEVRAEVARITQQLEQQRQAAPAPDELRRLVLERLINDRAQLQKARENGVSVDDNAVDQAEQGVARQNQVDVAELRKRLARDGVSSGTFRAQLRDQLILQRLREREVEGRVRVSDADVERFLQDKQDHNTDPFAQDINLGHLLIAVPEKASPEQAAGILRQAQQVLTRLRAGEDFAALVAQLSAADKTNGGALGLRRADRYPPPFVLATQALAVGQVSEIVRSAAGFHILKVLEKRAPATYTQSVVQTRARHILLRTGPQLSQSDALARLAQARARIVAGSTDFQTLARDMSQDGSAAQGGDLGWAAPGMFVPEFEDVMNHLNEGELSAPVVSRFGAHLIQVLERRRVDLGPRELREAVRAQLRESRLEEAYASWARDVRDRAFVEMREPPL